MAIMVTRRGGLTTNGLIRLLLAAGLSLATGSLQAQVSYNVNAHGVALDGFDVVSYFTDRRARSGEANWQTRWDGVLWYFSDAQNRERFIAKPQSYIPQYGGWCALAMASGKVAEVDLRDAWTIDDGKLYLNLNKDVRLRWQRGLSRYVRKADRHWPDTRIGLQAGTENIYRKSHLVIH